MEETVLYVLPMRMLPPGDGRPFVPPPTAQWIPKDAHYYPSCTNDGNHGPATDAPAKQSGDAPQKPDRKRARRPGGKPPKARPVASQVPPRQAIQVTLRLYDALRRNLLQEEEIKGKDTGRGRADLFAGSIINSKGLFVYRKVLGSFPGVEIGDHFFFRMQISSLGLHGPNQGGIDYLTARESPCNAPVAISIFSSGAYDDRDDAETLIYTGQGGKSDSKGSEDQKLERGNLAMENSIKFQVPVRVIRGIKSATSPTGKIYTYDGLYQVEKCWSEKGKLGFEEFKFQLQRLAGQPELGSAVIKLTNNLKQNPSMREGLRVVDISRGTENVAVCIVNTVDDGGPPAFEYSTKVLYPCNFSELQLGVGCDCKGVCTTSKECRCFLRNGNEFAYLNSGVLVKEKDIIYECGSMCSCPPACRNRLTQKGLKHHLEIFKTGTKRWGLRSWDSIPAGSFVCEYTGRAFRIAEATQSARGSDYVLKFSKAPDKETRWGDVSGILENQFVNSSIYQTVSLQGLMLNATEIGNAARFISHSCSSNLLAQPVLYDHHDIRFPHIMLFAMDDIPPLRELTLDYYSLSVVPKKAGTACVEL